MNLLTGFILVLYGFFSIALIFCGINLLFRGESVFEGFSNTTIGELILGLVFLPALAILAILQLSIKILSYQPFKRKK